MLTAGEVLTRCADAMTVTPSPRAATASSTRTATRSPTLSDDVAKFGRGETAQRSPQRVTPWRQRRDDERAVGIGSGVTLNGGGHVSDHDLGAWEDGAGAVDDRASERGAG